MPVIFLGGERLMFLAKIIAESNAAQEREGLTELPYSQPES